MCPLWSGIVVKIVLSSIWSAIVITKDKYFFVLHDRKKSERGMAMENVRESL